MARREGIGSKGGEEELRGRGREETERLRSVFDMLLQPRRIEPRRTQYHRFRFLFAVPEC